MIRFTRSSVRRLSTRAALAALTVAVSAVGLSAPESGDAEKDKDGWTSLFDGESLKGWEATEFGGEGEVKVEDGRILLGTGNDLTGIHTERKLPKIDYEVELEAMRVDGSDFFCGLTFPVGESHCSLIVGGWGGGVCGLSSLDGLDASENETTSFREFKSGVWYPIRLRVTEKRIEAWIEGKQVVDQDITGKKISVRAEVLPSRPFGFASYQTTAALRKIRVRDIDAKPDRSDTNTSRARGDGAGGTH